MTSTTSTRYVNVRHQTRNAPGSGGGAPTYVGDAPPPERAAAPLRQQRTQRTQFDRSIRRTPIGGRIAGGDCDDCDGHGVVERHAELPNVRVLRVEHAETCPRRI